eukprot:6459709-Amphidinium_carterae.1
MGNNYNKTDLYEGQWNTSCQYRHHIILHRSKGNNNGDATSGNATGYNRRLEITTTIKGRGKAGAQDTRPREV